jgi:hypothetical protein
MGRRRPSAADARRTCFQSLIRGSELIPIKQAVLMQPRLDSSRTCRHSNIILVLSLSCKELVAMIPYSRVFDQQTLSRLLEHDPLVQRYRAFFALFDWRVVPDPSPDPSRPGMRPHPPSAYLKALLLKLEEGLTYCTRLRRFLLEQPVLQALLAATVRDLREEIPGLGEVVAVDVTHLYAFVRENNPRVYVKDRYDKQHQPKGDSECRVGVKKSTNQEQADGSTKEVKEYLWGYGSGVVSLSPRHFCTSSFDNTRKACELEA